VSEAFRILERLRAGEPLAPEDLQAAVAGAADGSWADSQLGALLMGVAIRGLDPGAAVGLTRAMVDSGERWALGEEVPGLGDKHSTGGVGDKVSLVLGPLLAACGRPVVMLAGRGLGHTGGTADKLETVPGLSLAISRRRALELLAETGLAVGVATDAIAPADRRLYALRDVTATIRSLPLVVASILSKKIATGASALALDVKVGSGAFFPELARARELARRLVDTAQELGLPATALLTDMSQPLGRWAGHAVEVEEALACLGGEGPPDLLELTLRLAEELAALTGAPVTREELAAAIGSGRARERFELWAERQGAEVAWLARPVSPRAPVEVFVRSPREGVLAAIDTERLGLLLAEAGGGRARPEDAIDPAVALRTDARLGDAVEAGQPLARFRLRREDPSLERRAAACFTVAGAGQAPPLVHERVA